MDEALHEPGIRHRQDQSATTLHLTLPSVIGAPQPVAEHMVLTGTLNNEEFSTVLPSHVAVDHGRLRPTSLSAPRGLLMEQVRVTRCLRRERETRNDQDQSLLSKSIGRVENNRYYTRATLDNMKLKGVLSSTKSRSKAAEMRMSQLSHTSNIPRDISHSHISMSSNSQDARGTKSQPVSAQFSDPLQRTDGGEIMSSVIDVAGVSEPKFQPSRILEEPVGRDVWVHPSGHPEIKRRQWEDAIEQQKGVGRQKKGLGEFDRRDGVRQPNRSSIAGLQEQQDCHARLIVMQRVESKNDLLYRGKTGDVLQSILSSQPSKENAERITVRQPSVVDIQPSLNSRAGGQIGSGNVRQAQQARISSALDGLDYEVLGGVHTYNVAAAGKLDRALQQAAVTKVDVKPTVESTNVQTAVAVQNQGVATTQPQQALALKPAFTPKQQYKQVPSNFYRKSK